MVLLTDGSEAAVMLTDGSGLVVKGVGMVPSYSGKGRGSFAFPLPSCEKLCLSPPLLCGGVGDGSKYGGITIIMRNNEYYILVCDNGCQI